MVYEPGVTYAASDPNAITNQNDNWWQENEPEIEKAVAAAAKVDVIVACIGDNSYCETPGKFDRPDTFRKSA